jgi:hypothetical protein
MSRNKILAAVGMATAALLLGLNAGTASAASAPTTPVMHKSVTSARNSTTPTKPAFVGFCVTVWSTSGTSAITNCTTGVGLYNQFIHCAGIAKPVLGPVLFAPSVYIGSCPAGHNVINAGADLL